MVSSARIGVANWPDLLGWREYFVMVLYMEAGRVGFRLKRVLSGEWLDVEVNMRVFIGLTKHPSDLPRALKWSLRNSRSSRRTQAETLLTKPRRCVMPPAPSSLGLPLLSWWVVRACRSLSRGLRRHATTRDAKMGERGKPWITPSSMRRVHQVPSVHLWWTVLACS